MFFFLWIQSLWKKKKHSMLTSPPVISFMSLKHYWASPRTGLWPWHAFSPECVMVCVLLVSLTRACFSLSPPPQTLVSKGSFKQTPKQEAEEVRRLEHTEWNILTPHFLISVKPHYSMRHGTSNQSAASSGIRLYPECTFTSGGVAVRSDVKLLRPVGAIRTQQVTEKPL